MGCSRCKAYRVESERIRPGVSLYSYTLHLAPCFNELTRIDGLQGLVALRELYLANNKIGAIEGLHGLPALRLLELGSNRLRAITQLDHLSSLEELHLGRNKLTQLDGLQALAKLRVLGVVSHRGCVGLRPRDMGLLPGCMGLRSGCIALQHLLLLLSLTTYCAPLTRRATGCAPWRESSRCSS